MTDMMEKCREIARELTQDRARILSREQLINLSVVILALVGVAETLRDQTIYSCSACEKNLEDATHALTTCEAKIAEVFGESLQCEGDK